MGTRVPGALVLARLMAAPGPLFFGRESKYRRPWGLYARRVCAALASGSGLATVTATWAVLGVGENRVDVLAMYACSGAVCEARLSQALRAGLGADLAPRAVRHVVCMDLDSARKRRGAAAQKKQVRAKRLEKGITDFAALVVGASDVGFFAHITMKQKGEFLCGSALDWRATDCYSLVTLACRRAASAASTPPGEVLCEYSRCTGTREWGADWLWH